MGWMSEYGLDIRVWDVSHGNAAFVRAGKKNVVLDCGANTGNPEFSPARWIRSKKFGINTIHYMIISHPHHDHIEDLDQFEEFDLKPKIFQRPKKASPIIEEKLEEARDENDDEYIEDANYYLELDNYSETPDVLPSNPDWVGIERSGRGYRTDGGTNRGITFHSFGTRDPSLGSDNWETLNNLSKVTIINAFGFKFVSTGDLLDDGIEAIMEKPSAMDAIENAEVLMAPHHGREESFVKEFVEHVNPTLVIFSDKGGVDNTANDKYRELTEGDYVYHEGEDHQVGPRYVLTTRNDGRIRIRANNKEDWKVSIYGTNYASDKARSRRYNRVGKYN